MTRWQLQILDLSLTMIHLTVIGINVFGWAFPSTRRVQRWVLGLTTLSWLGLGMCYGIGYCFLTDWQWDIKRALGEEQLPASFIQYLIRNRLGVSIPDLWVDLATGVVFVLILSITGTQIARERKKT